ncbi:MAG: 4Fe-4S binding protein [Spirochaetales bacterium]|nr:4Fe-4S binding protein [Spirochaetales bacterium]
MTTKRLLFIFQKNATEKPVMSYLVRDYNLEVNIYRAMITPAEEGYLVVDVTGSDEDIRRGMDYAKGLGVTVNDREKGLSWNEELCTGCGNCLSHCPTGALKIADPATRRITFEEQLCVECLNCIPNCPYGACSSIFRE